MKTTRHTSPLQRWLESVWYDNKGGHLISRGLLMPLTGFYCVLSRIKKWKDLRQAPLLNIPVIVVGNITVGGTGKTPLVIHLAKLLEKSGYKPAIITRGYGGTASSWPQAVLAESDTSLVGDEAVLMASRTGVPVYAGANRIDSIRLIQQNHDCDVILSDDGLQHYKLLRELEIVVIDGKRLLGNGLCLPAGPLREGEQRLNNCDVIVINGNVDVAKSLPIFNVNNCLSMQIDGDVLINLKTLETKSFSEFKEINGKAVNSENVHAVTGIGNPQRFYQTLEKKGLTLIRHDFPDHYRFQPSNFHFNEDMPIVMTEKDAVKCKAFATDAMWFLPVEAKFDEGFDEMILVRLKPLINHKSLNKKTTS